MLMIISLFDINVSSVGTVKMQCCHQPSRFFYKRSPQNAAAAILAVVTEVVEMPEEKAPDNAIAKSKQEDRHDPGSVAYVQECA